MTEPVRSATSATIRQIREALCDAPLADRAAHLAKLDGATLDVLVVGGGVTGAGVALDAASRGLRTGLVEKGDFASGTSSRSSKMVHGGFRYLQTGDVALVRESLRERRRLHRNAPHLVDILPFVIPLLRRDGIVNPRLFRAIGGALWSYQMAGAWRLGRRHKRLSARETIQHMPSLSADDVGGGYLMHDLRADDVRLTLSVLASAAEHGAAVLNHAECKSISAFGPGGRTIRVRAEEGTFELRARVVVNATGVWADRIVPREKGRAAGRLSPAKGVHLVLPAAKMLNDTAISLPVKRDRRTVSVINAGPFAYVGSTDTAGGSAADTPCIDASDVEYLLDGLNQHLREPVSIDDVTGGWAGLRPLLGEQGRHRSADLSRRHLVELEAPGFVTVTGGKLTTYRAMAEEATDLVVGLLDLKRRSITSALKLTGHADPTEFRHGNRVPSAATLIALDDRLAEPLLPGNETLLADAVRGLHAEMGLHLADILLRRTRLGTFCGRVVLADIARIGDRIMDWTDWSRVRKDAELQHARDVLTRELGALAAPLPTSAHSRIPSPRHT
ncbi:glycerol-3-phosphate dehydrogenase/oxidase [Nitratireductor sp. StC3]|uniref:glycerol-3-phosphate dehydrogenase/oxidase n=1 Tax=Nitratireductor sp. StC3 TaxID=2126741 RepID=UPI000D0D0772|nr:glycerol-3-phosphate dehydrogenase/oxidase [Nitratireductor sp. StC3]PSM15810.1 FAD-dependent oxidoreductase [Nitratireductor sp. StC3]